MVNSDATRLIVKRRIGRDGANSVPRGNRGASAYVALILAALLASFPVDAAAQPGEASSGAKGTPSRVDEKPTFWLVDENGAWRAPLPNWSLEDVMRVVDSRTETPGAAPWSIQSVDATGVVANGIARLRVELDVGVADGLVRVPLGLSEGVYIPTAAEEASGESRRGGFSYEGPGLCVLDVDRKTGEYVALFQTPFPTVADANASQNSAEPEKQAPGEPEKQDSPELNESTEAPESSETSATTESVPEESTPESDAPESDPAESVAPETEQAAPETAAPETAPEPASEPASEPETEPEAPRYEESETSEPTTQESTGRSGRESGRLRPNFYRLTLDLCFTVEVSAATKTATDEAEYRLVASFPPSLHSQLTLDIPITDVEVVSVKGAAADAPTPMTEDASQLKLRGLGRGGERVEIGWRRSLLRADERQDDERRVVLQAEDAVIVTELDSRGTTYDATLPIRVFGGETDSFTVELPPDATLTPDSVAAVDSNGASFEIASVRILDDREGSDDSSESPDETQGRDVEIRLGQKTSVATLSLKARSIARDAVADSNGRRPPRRLAGFSVRDAQKQFGQIRVVKSQDSDFNVTPVYGASSSFENSLEDGAEIYSFFSQPFLMTAEAYARETVVDARPEYLLTVDNEELTLRARFSYSIYGSKVREFRLRRNGWNLSRVFDSENIVNQEGIVPANDVGETVVPLIVPSDGEVVVELEFVRNVDPDPIVPDADADPNDLASFSASFPIPIASRVEPSPVVVVPKPDVDLEVYSDKIVGMTRKTARFFTLNLELPSDLRETPLYYQTRLARENDPDPLFVADIRRLKQRTQVFVRTEATLSEKGAIHVVESLEYRIEHEPLDVFEFQAPSRLLDSTRERGLKCFIDGRPQNLVVDPPETIPATDGDEIADGERPAQTVKSRYSTCRVAVETPRIGTCVATMQYDLDPIEIREGLTSQARVDIFQPKTDESVSNELTLTAPVGLGLSFAKPSRSSRRAEVDEESSDSAFQSFWNADPRKFSDDGKLESIRCASLVAEYSARFNVSLDSREGNVAIVDRAWVQSWFSDSARVDRVVWKMNCDRDFVEIRLPEQCAPDRVSVAIDGERLPVGGDAKRSLFFHDRYVRVPIDPSRRRRDVALEVSYVATNAGGVRGRTTAEFPDFAVDSVWIRRMYWQTIFNRDKLVVVDPRGWTPEFIVKRGAGLGALFFNRKPTMTQDELCDWVGAGRREPIAQEANVYLYSRFCEFPTRSETSEKDAPQLPQASLFVVNNAFLVFLGSGLALALGLGLVYLQVMSASQALVTRWALLVLCALALLFASLRPLLALLFLQTTTIGVILTIAVAATTALLERGEKKKRMKKFGDATLSQDKES